jgi:transcriptional regulator with XRE-family HTH domain
MEQKTFKDRLTDELNYQGISNKEFASKVGIGIGTLGMYLYRGSIPAADVAVKMTQVLNTTTEYLILGTDDKIPFKNQTQNQTGRKKKLTS